MSKNPFSPKDADRHYLWEMLVSRDIRAFVTRDWAMIEDDFVAEGFIGIDAGKQSDVDQWKLKYPNLESYKSEWLAQAEEFAQIHLLEDGEEALHRVTVLQNIEIQSDFALLHKKLFGSIEKKDGGNVKTEWQTLYRCKKADGIWKIIGFTGYIPLLFTAESPREFGKKLPENANQHRTAGPYAPVLEVNPGKLVVISGQAAIDKEGNVVGNTIEDQTAYTLDNCAQQLATAGCTLQDVFKVNVYMRDLKQWPRFNEVYQHYFQEPKPVRTAVESGLLLTLLVEIEMWAVKS